MSISNYGENKALDAFFNNTSFAVTTPYIKLHVGDPGENGTANAAGETTRKSASFTAASTGQVATDANLVWTSVAASETPTHFSIWDNVSAGNCLWTGTLTVSKPLNSGDTFQILAGSLVVTLE